MVPVVTVGRKRGEGDQLLQRLVGIDARLDDHEDRLNKAYASAADATQAWRSISRQVTNLLRTGPPAADSATMHADDTDEAVMHDDAAGLEDWVRWVVPAYDLSEYWPLCWQRHEGLVQQLVGLRRWHAALATELAGDRTARSRWFDALYRLNEHLARPISQLCLASHRDSPSLDTRRRPPRMARTGAST